MNKSVTYLISTIFDRRSQPQADYEIICAIKSFHEPHRQLTFLTQLLRPNLCRYAKRCAGIANSYCGKLHIMDDGEKIKTKCSYKEINIILEPAPSRSSFVNMRLAELFSIEFVYKQVAAKLAINMASPG